MASIESEFQFFREELHQLGVTVKKIVKVGNGSMDFHEIFYFPPGNDTLKSVYVQRHQLDDLIEKFREAYPKKNNPQE